MYENYGMKDLKIFLLKVRMNKVRKKELNKWEMLVKDFSSNRNSIDFFVLFF